MTIPADPTPRCGCIVGRTLSEPALGRLDAALGLPGGGSLGKLAEEYLGARSKKSHLAAHKYRCLGIKPGAPQAELVNDPESACNGADVRKVTGDAEGARGEDKGGGNCSEGGPDGKILNRPANYLARVRAKSAYTRDQRIAYLCKRLADDREHGFITYAHLAAIWGLSISDVRELSDSAHLMYGACRGDTSHERRRSVASGDRVKRSAWRVHDAALDGEGPDGKDLKAAAQALAVIQKAQAAQDRATGVAAAGTWGAMVRTPEFQALLGVILRRLRLHPEVHAAVVADVRAELDAKRAGGVFDDAIRLLEAVDAAGEEVV